MFRICSIGREFENKKKRTELMDAPREGSDPSTVEILCKKFSYFWSFLRDEWGRATWVRKIA